MLEWRARFIIYSSLCFSRLSEQRRQTRRRKKKTQAEGRNDKITSVFFLLLLLLLLLRRRLRLQQVVFVSWTKIINKWIKTRLVRMRKGCSDETEDGKNREEKTTTTTKIIKVKPILLSVTFVCLPDNCAFSSPPDIVFYFILPIDVKPVGWEKKKRSTSFFIIHHQWNNDDDNKSVQEGNRYPLLSSVRACKCVVVFLSFFFIIF